jgi:hypothetical protein
MAYGFEDEMAIHFCIRPDLVNVISHLTAIHSIVQPCYKYFIYLAYSNI